MPDSNILISQHDLPVLKDFVQYTRTNCNAHFSLHDGYNLLAKAIGYRNWNTLSKANKLEVMFSDVFKILKKSTPEFVKLISNHTSIALSDEQARSASTNLLYKFTPSNTDWLELSGIGRSAYNNEIKICLLPTNQPNRFFLVGFKSYLELLIKSQYIKEHPNLVTALTVKVAPSKIRTRTRPYKTEIPIYAYLEKYIRDAVFVETGNVLITNFRSIQNSDIELTEPQLHHLIAKSAFFYPSSYFYTLKVRKDSFVLYSHTEDGRQKIGIRSATKEEILHFKITHPSGSYFPAELLFKVNLLRGIPPQEAKENYFDFCNRCMCIFHGLSYI